jgi:hypothetical protein
VKTALVLANIASVFILGLGVIAALNQIGIATTVTTPILVAILATVAGILIVGVGGGLIKPMQSRAEQWLSKAEDETQNAAGQAAAYRAGSTDAATQVVTPAASAEPTQVVTPASAAESTQVLPDNRGY